MFWDNVAKGLIAQGTFLAIGLGLVLIAWIIAKIFEVASKAFDHIHVPTDWRPKLPRLPRDAWERVSEPAKKVAMKSLVAAAVMAIGIVAPLSFALWLAQARVAVDPVAYFTASVILSFFFVSLGGLYLLIKQRNTLREMGPYALLWYAVAISWLAVFIGGLPMALFSD